METEQLESEDEYASLSATEVLYDVDVTNEDSDGNLYGYHQGVVDKEKLTENDWMYPLYHCDSWLALAVGPRPYYIYVHAQQIVVAYRRTVLGEDGDVARHSIDWDLAIDVIQDFSTVRVVHRDTVVEDVGCVAA